jgi:glycosyltransferase involved in cell wall biosynthesis
MPRICLIPNVSGTGGMVSFRYKLTTGLEARGVKVTNDLADPPYQAVLIIGGTRQLAALWKVHRKGIRLVQRLDGINWIQRKRHTGVRHYIRAELGNLLQSSIRKKLADRIIYQSIFSRNWWEDWYGKVTAPASVIYNGVDLKTYSPNGSQDLPQEYFRLLVVEGSLGGGYDAGLENALSLAETLMDTHKLPMELMVVGQINPSLQTYWDTKYRLPIHWAGTVKRESIPEIDRSAHLLFAADLHPACPNSVIEALACGLPVAAFDTGALTELVPNNAGCIAPYGSDPWKVEKPDIAGLAALAAQTLRDLPPYRQAARDQAEKAFDLDVMVENYLDVLLEAVE